MLIWTKDYKPEVKFEKQNKIACDSPTFINNDFFNNINDNNIFLNKFFLIINKI